MDTNNVTYILTDGKHGYPAGSFYNRVFLVLTGRNDLNAVETLFDLFSRADLQRTRQLNNAAPGLSVAVGLHYNGEMSERELRETYPDVLWNIRVFIGTAFPECRALVEEARAGMATVEARNGNR